MNVLLHVGMSLLTREPTEGHAYEPTDGATFDPNPEVPASCASAAVLERANPVAKTIIESFMVVVLSFRIDRRQPHRLHRPFR